MPTALLTTTLVIWLYDYFMEEIPTLNGLLGVTINPLHILLTMEHSTRFILGSNTSKLLNTT